MAQHAASRGIAPLNEERRKIAEENIHLRGLVVRLREALIVTDNGYCRCSVCGSDWHKGDPEFHSPSCIATPAPEPKPAKTKASTAPKRR